MTMQRIDEQSLENAYRLYDSGDINVKESFSKE